MARTHGTEPPAAWRRRLREVIFGVETRSGKAFDIVLLWAILLSVIAVMIESVAEFREKHGTLLWSVEWFFTILFTIEYVLRLICVRRPLRYAFSFYGIVDFLAIVPTYLAIFIGGAQSLIVIRALRLLRVFRVLKLVHFMQDADLVLSALKNSGRKITAFLGSVLVIALIVGTLMYLIEGDQGGSGFTSIPRSMYWAIVTVTTVGFGDITPQTTLGQFLAGALMITGYSIIAVPTGIVSVELAYATEASRPRFRCPACDSTIHDADARHCKFCGQALVATTTESGAAR